MASKIDESGESEGGNKPLLRYGGDKTQLFSKKFHRSDTGMD
jgi:hypothetical protein